MLLSSCYLKHIAWLRIRQLFSVGLTNTPFIYLPYLDNKEEDSQCGDDATLNGDIAAPELDEQRDDDDDWSADISEEAIRLRENAQITGAVSALIASADAERPEKERVDMFYHFITEQAKQNPLPTRVLLDKARLLDVLQHSGIVLIEALFSGTELVPLVKKFVWSLYTNSLFSCWMQLVWIFIYFFISLVAAQFWNSLSAGFVCL